MSTLYLKMYVYDNSSCILTNRGNVSERERQREKSCSKSQNTHFMSNIYNISWYILRYFKGTYLHRYIYVCVCVCVLFCVYIEIYFHTIFIISCYLFSFNYPMNWISTAKIKYCISAQMNLDGFQPTQKSSEQIKYLRRELTVFQHIKWYHPLTGYNSW
jgi:hypothetical protein